MNPARSPTAAQASQEEATRTGSGRGRRIFPKRSPGPHRKGRVTWDLGRTFRRPFLVPHACGLRGSSPEVWAGGQIGAQRFPRSAPPSGCSGAGR